MRKIILSILIIFCFVIPPKKAQAQMDPKGKAFLIICTYGTVGGALLGFATMAFGTNSRAIAQGASLGLYAGIAFGSYVVSSHGQKQEEAYPEPQYNQGPPPGADAFDQGGFGGSPEPGYGDQEGSDGGGFFGNPQRYIEINEDIIYNYKLKNKKGRGFSPPVYINLFHKTF